jgi:type II secretion system protein H
MARNAGLIQSCLRCARRPRSGGFTLIEIVVVVAMIAIIISMVTLSMGPQEDRALKEEANRIGALLKLAREESILQSQELALAIGEDGYRFEIYDGAEWQVFASDDGVFRARPLPEGMELKVMLDQKPVELPKTKVMEPSSESADGAANSEKGDAKDQTTTTKTDAKDKARADAKKGDKKKEEQLIRIFILSSGEMTPFALFVNFADRPGGYRLTANGIGKTAVEKMDREEFIDKAKSRAKT